MKYQKISNLFKDKDLILMGERIQNVNFIELPRLKNELEYWKQRLQNSINTQNSSEDDIEYCNKMIHKITKKIKFIENRYEYESQHLIGRRENLSPIELLMEEKIREQELNGYYDKTRCNQQLSKLGRES